MCLITFLIALAVADVTHATKPVGTARLCVKIYLPVKYSNKTARKALFVINVTGAHDPVMGHRSSAPDVTATCVMRNESATRLIFRSWGVHSSYLATRYLWSPHDEFRMSGRRLLAQGDSLP